MVATAGIAAVPAAQRLIAPLLCPAGYSKSVVTMSTSSHRPGETTTTSELYCVDDQGRAWRQSTPMVMGATFGASLLVLIAGFGLLGLVGRLTRRGKTE
jgi:hypothetical protein